MVEYYGLTSEQKKRLTAFFLEQKAKDAIPYLNMLAGLPKITTDEPRTEQPTAEVSE